MGAVKPILLVAGLVAVAIGGFALLLPVSFRASYGIDAAGDLSLLNETRAFGGGLLAVGVAIAWGGFTRTLAAPAALLGTAVYGAYGLSRLLSLATDGRPDGGLLLAGAVELLLAAACATVVPRARRSALASS
ncbi:DUF4345 domain-containing protein [Dactylosporangium sp. AC04546]|uniref:DUF4345 domain-containing protein n=1 Tax=Dactylosporangium sp. AC04546 TaxID=2862460 RepID=UPI001EDCF41A|nr:DUF4345 domain-containing protein [Dactylosporangium sp. AC04546]WVK83663.1 DUF4345 domain-containing protein [Dactylosporangium sp. AC04546]